ncbi:hypothetical protein PNI0427_02191 [Streptococcus pneumoniae PNI0427]|nr:hypothetical protein PCS125219_00941 [Streptococcus pneumoniae PCS125219]ELU63736.1 hypothetical protein PNI0002_01766 [Streptococcus pneumoniae PNI0002]ELU74437.1 hypothetical protein PNI0007_00802 [Streptococcus pneumoniae PNI0007]ELU87879.1 hypothetical protein PNI0427_02191 [Streptococcus pneumoniae PNI0427]
MLWKELCHKLAPKVFKVIRIYSRENKKSPSNWAFCSFET